MSKPITFRYMPGNPDATDYRRASYWVHEATGVEIRKGYDDGEALWQIWTAGMGEGLGVRPTLNEAKDRARQLIGGDVEWARELIRKEEAK